VAHLPMTLVYDATRLELLAVEAGDFLGSSKNAEISSDGSTPGELVIGASRVSGASGVAGHGTVARVRFRALAEGAATLSIAAVRVMDADLAEVGDVAVTDSEVAIGELAAQRATARERGN